MAYSSGPTTAIASSHLKKQLRDVTRLISRPNLPADVRREQERKLQHLKILLAERETACSLAKLGKRYAKVRFFESKKAQRHVRQAARKLLAAPGEETLAAWREAKYDEIYVHDFPQTQKYISLWPTTPLVEPKVLAQRTATRARLAAESGIVNEKLSLEEAIAMAKVEIMSEGPIAATGEAALEAAESVAMNKAFAAGTKRKGGAAEDDDEDDEGDEEGDEDDDGEEQDLEDDDDDGEDFDDDDDDDDVEDEDDDDEDEDEDEEGDEEDEDDDEDEDEEGDEEDEDDDDDDEEEDDEDDEDDDDGGEYESANEDEDEEDEDGDEEDEEEASPKKARH